MSKDAARAAWISDDIDLAYHARQFEQPYRSTVAFIDWLEALGALDANRDLNILDAGCGQGANVHHLSARHPRSRFVGVDVNKALVDAGNRELRARGAANAVLQTGDLYRPDANFIDAVDVVLSFQTLSWLPEFREPLAAFAALRPDWICVSSLFYDGPVNCTIAVEEFHDDFTQRKDSFYNVYSLPLTQRHLRDLGYGDFHSVAFTIDIDLPKPADGRLGTYTEMLARGERLQISGPLLMPWRFIAARKSR
jgi:SAM-dependent methyltransferase